MKKLLLLFILVAGSVLVRAQNTWSSIAAFGGGERERAVAFVIGERAYVGTGVDSANVVRKDFWEYDPGSNSWTQKADLPGSARRDAITFAIGNRGYVGTGVSNVVAWAGTKRKDLYEYNPITNSWATKANWPGNFGQGIYYANAFATITKGYLICGKEGPSSYSNETWEYDPAIDTWTQKANFPPGGRYAGCAFGIGTVGYYGCGVDENYYWNDFWRFDPQSNTWLQRADFPGSPRFNPVGLNILGRGFIGMGSDGGYQKDFYEYNPSTDHWMQKANLSGSERRSCVAFTIGNYGYVGTGKGPDGVKRSMYKYKPYFLFTDENIDQRLAATVTPNPVHQSAQIILKHTAPNADFTFTVFDNAGKLVYRSTENNTTISFERNDLTAGIYYYEIKSENGRGELDFTSGKIFIQ